MAIDSTAPTTDGYLWRAMRSTGTLALFEAVNKVVRFVATVLLAHYLTLNDYGLVNVGIAVSGILVAVTALGLPDVGAREVALDRQATNPMVNLVVRVRIAAVIAILAATIVVLLSVGASGVTVAVGGAVIALTTSLSADWALRGLERMRSAGVANLIGGTVVLSLSALLVYLTRSVLVALGVWATGELSIAIYTHWKLSTRLAHVSLRSIRAILGRSWPIGLSTLVMYAYYANLDTVLLSAMRSPSEAGLYSAPYRVFLAFSAVGPFAAYAFLPLIARGQQGNDRRRIDSALRTAAVGLAAYATVILGVVEISGQAILIHLFGRKFAPAQDAFIILCIGIAWYTMALPVGYGFVAERVNRRFVTGALIAGILNVALNFALIPSTGRTGAAIATTASFAVAAACWIVLSRRGIGFLLTVVALPALATIGGIAAIVVPEAATAVGIASLVIAVAAAAYTITYEVRLLSS